MKRTTVFVPEPSSFLLLGSALLGLIYWIRQNNVRGDKAVRQKILIAALILGLFSFLRVGIAQATAFAEIGDAGELLGTAQITTGTNPLTQITGNITSIADADMFRIHISDPTAFSATTVGTAGTMGDTQLFLFNSAGIGVYANDDESAPAIRSTLPSGNPNGPNTPGDYFLVITGFDRDPASGGGQIFCDITDIVCGPTGPGGGSAITGYDPGITGSSGTYTIVLSGAEFATAVAAVPEPMSSSLLLFGLGALGMWRRLRAKQD